MSTDTRTASQIEQDLERERAELASSLEALQERISIEGITRQITEQISRHGGDIGRSAMNSVKANPLPLALTGIGLAWMMMNDAQGRHVQGRGNGNATADGAARRWDGSGQSMGHHAAESAEALHNRMRQGTEQLSEAARARVVEARERAHRARSAVARQTGQAGRQMAELFNDQPIVAGALALALGAVLGTTVPRTQVEDQMLGETSDRLFEDAERIFRDEVEKARQATEAPSTSPATAGDGRAASPSVQDREIADTGSGGGVDRLP